jgi:hypothetical protein
VVHRPTQRRPVSAAVRTPDEGAHERERADAMGPWEHT